MRTYLPRPAFRHRKPRNLIIDRTCSYINSIVQQNKILRARAQSIQAKENATEASSHPPPGEKASPQQGEPRQNPLLGETPWFVKLKPFNVPLRVGEGADTAFSTRFRQAISRQSVRHPPRLQYPSEAQIMALSETDPQVSPAQAHFLVRAALASIDGSHHMVRKSLVWALVDRFIEAPKTLDLLARCKIFALCALGELFTSHCKAPGNSIPGIAYFSLAFKAYGYLLERPCLDSIEVTLLLVRLIFSSVDAKLTIPSSQYTLSVSTGGIRHTSWPVPPFATAPSSACSSTYQRRISPTGQLESMRADSGGLRTSSNITAQSVVVR